MQRCRKADRRHQQSIMDDGEGAAGVKPNSTTAGEISGEWKGERRGMRITPDLDWKGH
jgi:hypothetical protein